MLSSSEMKVDGVDIDVFTNLMLEEERFDILSSEKTRVYKFYKT